MYRASAKPRPAGTLASLAGERIAGSANWRLYALCRRSGDWEGAEDVLRQMLRRRQMCGAVCVELSKLYEHRRRDYPTALEWALQSEKYPDGETAESLQRRMDRIRRKMKQSED